MRFVVFIAALLILGFGENPQHELRMTTFGAERKWTGGNPFLRSLEQNVLSRKLDVVKPDGFDSNAENEIEELEIWKRGVAARLRLAAMCEADCDEINRWARSRLPAEADYLVARDQILAAKFRDNRILLKIEITGTSREGQAVLVDGFVRLSDEKLAKYRTSTESDRYADPRPIVMANSTRKAIDERASVRKEYFEKVLIYGWITADRADQIEIGEMVRRGSAMVVLAPFDVGIQPPATQIKSIATLGSIVGRIEEVEARYLKRPPASDQMGPPATSP